MTAQLATFGGDADRERIAELEAILAHALPLPPGLADWSALRWHAKALYAWLWKRNNYRMGNVALNTNLAAAELGASETAVRSRWLKELYNVRLVSRVDTDPLIVRLHAVDTVRPPEEMPKGVRVADRPDPQSLLFEPTDEPASLDVGRVAPSTKAGGLISRGDEQAATRTDETAGPRSCGPAVFRPPDHAPEAATVPATDAATHAADRASLSMSRKAHMKSLSINRTTNRSGDRKPIDHDANAGSGGGTGAAASMGNVLAGLTQNVNATLANPNRQRDAVTQLVAAFRRDLGNPAALRDDPLERVAWGVVNGRIELSTVDRVIRFSRRPNINNVGAYFVITMQREFHKRGLVWPQKDGKR